MKNLAKNHFPIPLSGLRMCFGYEGSKLVSNQAFSNKIGHKKLNFVNYNPQNIPLQGASQKNYLVLKA